MRTRRSERGSGVVGAIFGAVVFFAFVLLATHVLVGLYATSTATAASWDAARSVASNPGNELVLANADAELRQDLSGFAAVSIDWQTANDQVGLHVVAQRPSILPDALMQSRLTSIDRTVWIREEDAR